MTDKAFAFSLLVSMGLHAALYFSPGTLLKEYLARPERSSFRVDYYAFSGDGGHGQKPHEVTVAEKPQLVERKEVTAATRVSKTRVPEKAAAGEARAPAVPASGVDVQPAAHAAKPAAVQKKRSQPEAVQPKTVQRPLIDRKAVASYFRVLRERLRESTVYPYELKREGIQGIVKLEFTLKASGELASVRMTSSSGDERLDAAALDGMGRASPFPCFPPEVKALSLAFSVSILFGTI